MRPWWSAEQTILQLCVQLLSHVSQNIFFNHRMFNKRQNSLNLMKIDCEDLSFVQRSRSFSFANCCTHFNRAFNFNSGNRVEQLGTPYKRGKPCSSCQQSCSKKIRFVNIFECLKLIKLKFALPRLCVNGCNAADLWANCRELYKTWPDWLCRTNTTEGMQRQHNCLATCNCQGKIHD